MERLNGTYCENVLDCYQFDSLAEVREVTGKWMDDYTNHRAHDSPGKMLSPEYDILSDFESGKQVS